MSLRKDYVPTINNPKNAEALAGLYNQPNHLTDAKNIVNLIPSSAAKVLDAGCGTGRLATVLNSEKYFGVDLASHLLEKAKTNFPNHKFDLMNIKYLVFPDESFDAVLSITVLKHFHRKEVTGVFNELVRVCKKGGTIIIRVPIIPETRHYNVYDAFLPKNIDYEDIAFHWSDIFALANRDNLCSYKSPNYCAKFLRLITMKTPKIYPSHNLTIVHPESFLTSKDPYTAPLIVFRK